MSPLDPMAAWQLADRLSVQDAALLIAGVDPEEVHQHLNNYKGYTGSFRALRNAIEGGTLRAELAYRLYRPNHWDDDVPSSTLLVIVPSEVRLELLKGMPVSLPDRPIRLQEEPDWERSTVDVDDLKAWCRSRGQRPAFLFPNELPPDFMSPDHPRYSAKLACAVAAWEATDEAAPNKTPKQTIELWVRRNAVRFGLLKDDGTVNETAVDEVSKVVNWNTKGGAPVTGG